MITAIIPVRKGSRRLKGKNTASFSGSNLLLYKIEQLKTVEKISQIIVSSDCDDMLCMAYEMGAVIHKRADEYCDEETKSFGEVVEHICENVTGEHILWATCTSPLVEPYQYSEAINCYFKALSEGYDSLMSVEEFRRYIWDDKGPLNYKLGIYHVPSQNLSPLYRVTDGILLAPRLKMIEWQYFHGSSPYLFKMDKRSSIDIDDVYDLACAKAWLDLKF
ncbi:MAG: cytidylyltransferase domain-containing protein [Dolichospermum sp.]